ncbi:hypothetical protein [Capsulimonas sp.]
MGHRELTISWYGSYQIDHYGDMGRESDETHRGSFRLAHNAIQLMRDRSSQPKEYQAVTWGKRHYLIASADMIAFCSSVNDGEFVKNDAFRSEWLLDGNEKFPLTSEAPDVSAQWRGYLLPNALHGKVTRVINDHTEMVDIGAATGLRCGMNLHIDHTFLCLTVTAIDSHGATVNISDPDTEDHHAAKGSVRVGAHVSSRLEVN